MYAFSVVFVNKINRVALTLFSVRFTFNFETKMTEVRCTPHMQSITVLKSDTMDLVKTDSLSDREIFPRRYGKKFF